MDDNARIDMETALQAIASMIHRSEKAQEKFAPGTSQHTLQRNRIKALTIASALISRELDGSAIAVDFSKEDLEQAAAPIASLVSKSEKARQKLKEDSWQYRMLENNLKALYIASSLLSKMLNEVNMEDARAVNPDILMMFDKLPAAFPLYEAGEAKILATFPDVRVKVSKTQVSFYNKHLFAALWPPMRRIKGRSGVYIVLTFGLGYRTEHPRIVESVEPYPNRWTHHVLIAEPEEFDDQVMGWLREAYDFSMNK